MLLNRIVKESKKKEYDLGIVAHFHDSSSELIARIAKDIPNSILLDVKSDTYSFTKKLTKCKAVISTAMHPIVAADSYGIPNIWATTGNSKISSYKFGDYYSAFGIYNVPVFQLDSKRFDRKDLEEIISNYSISREQVEKIQENLIESFPFKTREKEIRFLTSFDIAYLRWRAINVEWGNMDIARRIKYFLELYMR